jgi:hypothetical protein
MTWPSSISSTMSAAPNISSMVPASCKAAGVPEGPAPAGSCPPWMGCSWFRAAWVWLPVGPTPLAGVSGMAGGAPLAPAAAGALSCAVPSLGPALESTLVGGGVPAIAPGVYWWVTLQQCKRHHQVNHPECTCPVPYWGTRTSHACPYRGWDQTLCLCVVTEQTGLDINKDWTTICTNTKTTQVTINGVGPKATNMQCTPKTFGQYTERILVCMILAMTHRCCNIMCGQEPNTCARMFVMWVPQPNTTTCDHLPLGRDC